MPNMWSTGQPITASMTESPAGTVHAPGTKSYTITATDTDTAFPGYIGPVPDTLTYTWTATRGTISGGASAAWSIPADTRGLISCQVVIDDVATMPPGDFGARNDNPITLNRSMVVPYANAEYEAFSTDNMYGIAKFRFKLSNVGCTCQQLKVEYQEQASGYHQCDWTPILTEGNPAQLISTTTDADGVVNQIYEMSWNTLGLHNADYQLRLKADYNCNCHQTAFRSVEQIHTVNVKNLDITTCNPWDSRDFLRWDPNQGVADTTIRCTLEDNGGVDATTLDISIYHSDRTANPNPVRTATVTTGSGSVYNYVWNGFDSSGVACPTGIYLFTVTAHHSQTGGTDTVSDRASDAFVVEDRLLPVTGQYEKRDFQAKVQGTVSDSLITCMDPQLVILGSTTGSTPLSSPPLYVTSDWLQVARVDWSPEIAGPYVFLMSGKDGTPGNDKSHMARPVLGRNQSASGWAVNVYYDDTRNFGQAHIAAQIWAGLIGKLTHSSITYSKFVRGWHKYNGKYAMGTFPADVPRDTVFSGFIKGQMKVNSPTYSGTPPVIAVYVGHGEETLIAPGGGTITSSDITNGTFTGSSSPYRLSVLLSCWSCKSSSSIGQAFKQKGWRVIGTKAALGHTAATIFTVAFTLRWSVENYDLTDKTVKDVFTGACADVMEEMGIKSYSHFADLVYL